MSLFKCIESTEVGDAGVGRLDLIGDTEDGRDLHERRRHHLTVEDGLAEVDGGLRPQNPARPRWLHRPGPGERPRQGRHRDQSLPVTALTLLPIPPTKFRHERN